MLELRDGVGAARLALDVLGTSVYLHGRHADLVAAKRRRESNRLVTVLVDEEVAMFACSAPVLVSEFGAPRALDLSRVRVSRVNL